MGQLDKTQHQRLCADAANVAKKWHKHEANLEKPCIQMFLSFISQNLLKLNYVPPFPCLSARWHICTCRKRRTVDLNPTVHGSVLRHSLLKGISAQIVSAAVSRQAHDRNGTPSTESSLQTKTTNVVMHFSSDISQKHSCAGWCCLKSWCLYWCTYKDWRILLMTIFSWNSRLKFNQSVNHLCFSQIFLQLHFFF